MKDTVSNEEKKQKDFKSLLKQLKERLKNGCNIG